MRRQKMKKNPEEITIRNAINAGVMKAFKDSESRSLVEVTPKYADNETLYEIRGDVNEVLRKIAANSPVGSRDVLEAIKSCRSAIYLFGQGVQR
jgi:hypothetical protein